MVVCVVVYFLFFLYKLVSTVKMYVLTINRIKFYSRIASVSSKISNELSKCGYKGRTFYCIISHKFEGNLSQS